MELTGKIIGIKNCQKPILSLEINEKYNIYSNEFEKLYDKDKISIEIKQFRKKRSKDANAYFWKLCTEIGNVLCKSKEEVYFQMLQSYGQSQLIPIREDIDISGYFKYYEAEGSRKGFTYYKIYKGSSEYDSREMYILIQGTQNECVDLGIPTLDDIRMNQLIEEWGDR